MGILFDLLLLEGKKTMKARIPVRGSAFLSVSSSMSVADSLYEAIFFLARSDVIRTAISSYSVSGGKIVPDRFFFWDVC